MLLVVAAPRAEACAACGVPHIVLLSSDPDAGATLTWLGGLEKRGAEVHVLDCRRYQPAMLDQIKKAAMLLVDGSPHSVRQWKPLIALEVHRFLETGKPVGLLWSATDLEPDPAVTKGPTGLEDRVRELTGVRSLGDTGAGTATAHPNHRGRKHAILRGVDLKQLPDTLTGTCVLGAGSKPVVTLGPGTPLVWTGEHREQNGRVGAVVVIQSANRGDYASPTFRKLIANSVFWALGWDDLIPPDGLATE